MRSAAGSVGQSAIRGLLAIRGRVNGGAWVTYYVLSDPQGNVVALATSDGTLAAQYDYDPYGRLIRETGPKAATCPFRYSTKWYDADLGLLHYGYRWYDAAAMKWLSPDPIGERGGANLTAFCDGDPVNNVDPLRLERWTRCGHHIIPVDGVEAIEQATGTWSDDLVKALDAQRIVTATRHGWDTAHAQYNLRIRGILEQYLKETKIDPTELRGKVADDGVAGLVKRIENSGDEFITGYLTMLRSGKSVRETTAWAARYRDEVLSGVRKGRGAYWLEKSGDDAAELAGRTLARSAARRGAKLLKVAGPVVIIYFVATSADAGEALEAILPPGVDYAWSYAGRFYERTFDGARAIGLGHPTPAQLESDIPFIRGIAQRSLLLRELLEDN